VKRLIPIIAIALCIGSCEWFAEQDTPACKECYNVTYTIDDNTALDTTNEKTLCGGDILNWETIPADNTDTTVTRYLCE